MVNNPTGHPDDDESVVIFHAPDEIVANLIVDALEAEGISAMISSQQIPWYDGIMQVAKGYWGDIRVLRSQEEQARKVVEDFLSVPPEEDKS
jgi:hypothetical protein